MERITEDRPYMSYPIHVGTSFYMGYYAYTEIDRSLSVFAEQHSIIFGIGGQIRLCYRRAMCRLYFKGKKSRSVFSSTRMQRAN